ncbi:transmembrane channel-like protein 5 [Cololabis saira]|uniref:transmembrane channel-like protein 5 n=1 Tax=Cololabis saira TaxID=129043 RepID=UPI002AD53DAF|nr:transmembrane channel-like protein 5 [Cololabis saira]
MTNYGNEGLFNPAYHDSETLEIDKRSSSRNHHTNPYAGDNSASWGERAGFTESTTRGAPRSGWQEESWKERESIPMGHMTSQPGGFSRQRNLNHSRFQIDPDSQYDQSLPVQHRSSMSGNMTMRWRGMRRMSMFPNADPAHLAITEDAIRSEMENEEQNLVKELVSLSTREQIQAIRNLPMSFEEKKHIRNQVLVFKTFKKSRQFTCFADCSENMSLSLRRCGYSIRSARQTLELWQGIMKEIGGKFGSSVLTYFVFLKWLLIFNIFSFLVNFGFITIPHLIVDPSPHLPPNVKFSGLELLTGAGFFNYTVMYYGVYSTGNTTLEGYDRQLAYFFTTSLYMVLCGIVLIFSMTSSFKKNYVLADPASNSAWQLLCSWDFTVTNERAVRRRKNNLRVQLKESLSEKAQGKMLTLSEKLKHYGVHVGSWLLSTSLAVGCGASIFYLCKHEEKQVTDDTSWSLEQEAKTLLVPFVVSLMNLVIPLIFSLFNKFENYSSQRRQIYALVARNVFLRMSILAVLCYYWIYLVPPKFLCWESVVGQALYRLVVFDFFFQILGSFFGEFLSNVIGTKLYPALGVPEFDVARNVLELIYAQTLAWIGIYFSPLLPAIQILKFFIIFYLKKISLTHNCQPPRRSGRAAQMQTIFIFLLFFPFFVGALSVVAYTSWSLIPSEHCGPFRGLNNTFSVVGNWMDRLEESHWVVWIYENVIRSEIFYFLLTLIILVIINIFWQLTKGRKELIAILKQQIVNEGKDKSFLLDKLQNLQKSNPKRNPDQRKQKGLANRHSDDHHSRNKSNSNAMFQALLARQHAEEEEVPHRTGGASVPSGISTSSALKQAMLAREEAQRQEEDLYQKPNYHPSSFNALPQAMAARQRAEDEEIDEYSSATGFYENPLNKSSAVTQAMQARLQAEEDEEDDSYDHPSPVSDVMIQVMQARQRAEEEDRREWVPAPPPNPLPSSSNALIQAMLARQQAQNEYDDGY